MKRFAALLPLMFVAGWTAPALAQSSSAAAAPRRHLSAIDQARDVMNRYGICIVKIRPTAVMRALSREGDGAIEEALARLADSECLAGGDLRMSRTLFRGAIYRALYLRDYADTPAESLAALGSAKVEATRLTNFHDCVVRLSPENSRTLVTAEVGSGSEAEAIAALRPALADCLPPGVQVHLTPWGLQGSLSEALYKRTAALAAAPKQEVVP